MNEPVEMTRALGEHPLGRNAAHWTEQRYRTLFDLGPVAVYSCDAAGVIQEFNNRAVELWGRRPELGDTDERFCGSFKLYRPDGSFMPHALCPMAEVVAGTRSEVVDGEVHIERPDGSRITVVVNIRPVIDQHGEVIGAINCFYDVTARKETEQALRDSHRRKDEFLAMLAHELRNPLAPISNALHVLKGARMPGAGGSVDAAIQVLDRQVGHMVRLIDDLLDAGRINGGKMVLRLQRVELRSAIQDAVEAVRPMCDSLDHELIVTLPPNPVYVNADPTRLTQIVGNLLNNACKFTNRGGHIWLTACADDTLVTIRVRDTGIGIAADELPRIFDIFTQMDTTLNRPVSGLGIGLTLVKTLAQMHGGRVDVTSAGIGQGSEFVVRLPIIAVDRRV